MLLPEARHISCSGLKWCIRIGMIGFVMQSPNQMISKPMIAEEVGLGLAVRGVPEEEIKERVNDTLRIASEDAAVAYLEGKGCTVTYPDLPDFIAHVQQYYADHPEQTETWNMELYEEIQALAK